MVTGEPVPGQELTVPEGPYEGHIMPAERPATPFGGGQEQPAEQDKGLQLQLISELEQKNNQLKGNLLDVFSKKATGGKFLLFKDQSAGVDDLRGLVFVNGGVAQELRRISRVSSGVLSESESGGLSVSLQAVEDEGRFKEWQSAYSAALKSAEDALKSEEVALAMERAKKTFLPRALELVKASNSEHESPTGSVPPLPQK